MTRSRHGPDPVSPAYPFPPAPYRTARLVLVEAAVPRPARAEKNETISASRRDDRRAGCHPCGWSRPADSADWTSTRHHTAWSGARRRAGGRKTARHETAAARGASNGFDDVPALEQRESAHPRAPGIAQGSTVGRLVVLCSSLPLGGRVVGCCGSQMRLSGVSRETSAAAVARSTSARVPCRPAAKSAWRTHSSSSRC